MKPSIWVPAVFIVLAYLLITVAVFALRQRKLRQLQQYWNIEIGMPEGEMLLIMGKGYNRSLLKNGRTKYEWRINATSSSYSHKGYNTRHYTGVKKVTIYVRSGCVEEVLPYNI